MEIPYSIYSLTISSNDSPKTRVKLRKISYNDYLLIACQETQLALASVEKEWPINYIKIKWGKNRDSHFFLFFFSINFYDIELLSFFLLISVWFKHRKIDVLTAPFNLCWFSDQIYSRWKKNKIWPHISYMNT